MSDFVHDPNPLTAVINGPQGSTVVTQENSSLFHPTQEQIDERNALLAEQAEALAELNQKQLEEATTVDPEAEPVQPEEEAPVPYRASTVAGDKAAVQALVDTNKITQEEADKRMAEIDEIAADPTLSPPEEPEPETPPEEPTVPTETTTTEEPPTEPTPDSPLVLG
jgi:hypothetical protein